MLVSLRNEDEKIFEKLILAHSYLTQDMLEIFYHIGTRSLHPLSVLLPKHVFTAVKGMSYEAQGRFCSEPVQVVTRLVKGGDPVVVRKRISQLTKDEAKWALNRKGNVPVQTQVNKIRSLELLGPAVPAKPFVEPTKRVELQRTPKVIGNYIIRHTPHGYAFEKTPANPYTTQRVLLSNGSAVISLTGAPNGQAIIQLAEYK